MPTILEQISADIITTMKERDMANQIKLSALKMAKAALQIKEKEKRSSLTTEDMQNVLVSLVKKHKESIEQFDKGGRGDLTIIERAQMSFIQHYLPAEATEKAIEEAVANTVSEIEQPTLKDMGAVIKRVKEIFSALNLIADGGLISKHVKHYLTKK